VYTASGDPSTIRTSQPALASDRKYLVKAAISAGSMRVRRIGRR
jgi:hypothetical protein